jgi:hypothetical protein
MRRYARCPVGLPEVASGVVPAAGATGSRATAGVAIVGPDITGG